MTGVFSHEEHCDLAGEEIARFVGVVREADPAVPVSTCGRWSLADLVHHTGVFHRWVEDLVARRAARDEASGETDDWDPNADMAAHADWLGAANKKLLLTLRDTDPDIPMWAWGADQHVRFWSRRATHETGVHRADAEMALGIEPTFSTAVAVDGVSEFLANVWHANGWRPRIGKLRGNGETISLSCADSPDEWTITLEVERPRWQRHEPGEGPKAEVAVRATAADLYLMLWGRYRCTDARFQVTGDAALLSQWQRNSAV